MTIEDEKVFRKYWRTPEFLSDPTQMGYLYAGNLPNAEYLIELAEEKLTQVMEGRLPFGRNVVIGSFQARDQVEYSVCATMNSLFIMHTLFCQDVMFTRHGKVSVFPVTVYTSLNQLENRENGFPCIAIHREHFKTLVWRRFSASRFADVCSPKFLDIFQHVVCLFDPNEDSALVTVSGFESYNSAKQKKEKGFILIPAHWIDVMKHFFIDQDTHASLDISFLFREIYSDIPSLCRESQSIFQDQYRAAFLGEERSANIMDMIKTSHLAHTNGMARCRAMVSEGLNIGKNGCRWNLPESKKNELAVYDTLSAVYGVECWDNLLLVYNTAYTFFTGNPVLYPHHMFGLLHLDDETKVKNRSICRKLGILNDNEGIHKRVSKLTRQARYKIKKEFAKTGRLSFYGDVGEVVVTYCRQQDNNCLDEQQPVQEEQDEIN